MEQSTLQIGGMTCQGCVGSVTRVLQALPGVAQVEVSLARNEAQVHYDPAQVQPEAFRQAIEGAGFDVQ